MGTLLILRFLHPFSVCSANSKLLLFCRGCSCEWLCLLLKRRMLLFSKLYIAACSFLGGDYSIT
jgi:hypothetical protein